MISRPLGISVWSLVTGRVASGVSRHAWLGHVPAPGSISVPLKGVSVRHIPLVSGDQSAGMDDSIPVTVLDGGTEAMLRVPDGTVLRDALLKAGFDVYGAYLRGNYDADEGVYINDAADSSGPFSTESEPNGTT